MKVLAGIAAALILCSSQAIAQPKIATGGVVNAASNLPNGLPGSGVAQGALFSITGTGFGPATPTQAAYPLTTNLAGTSAKVTVGGTAVDALIVSVSATQIIAL